MSHFRWRYIFTYFGAEIIEALKSVLSIAIVPLFLCSSIYMTVKLKAVNIRNLGESFSLAFGQRTKKGSLSAFSAFATVVGGNLGAGNIAGVAVGLQCGGPGCLFWIAVMCLISGIIKFAGSYLGVILRKRGYSESGERVGGPMIYLGLLGGRKIFPTLYVTLLIFSALTTGNLVQVNAVTSAGETLSISPVLIGFIMMGLVAYTILGNTKRFSDVVTRVVPAMTIGYFAISGILLLRLHDRIIPALSAIFTSAMSPQSFCGGLFSFSVWQAIRIGFDRGLMATDAGIGLESIVHSSAESHHPNHSNAMVQGLTSSISPLIVAIACFVTGMVMVVTDVWTLDICPTQMCVKAFSQILPNKLAAAMIFGLLYVFAFTTILTWAFCSTKGIERIARKNLNLVKIWKWIFIITVPLGTFCNTSALWKFADIGMNAMLLLNLSGVVILIPLIVRRLAKER